MIKSATNPKKEAFKIVLLCLLPIILLVLVIFKIVLPEFKSQLLKQKKLMLASETHIAWNILEYYEKLASSGEVSLEDAQRNAINQIQNLRYGDDGKDYFWLNDLQPKMIMHPYRTDLDGTDISTYADPKGKFLFKEFVDISLKNGAGYVEYVWQWKDDPDRLVPKVSHVKLFKPWGWIIGTGIYIEDIREEMSIITGKVIKSSLAILALIFVLLLFVIKNSVKEIHKRQAAEKELNDYKDHLEDLVEKRTAELQKANKDVKILSGLLPICASCKKIKDENGSWEQIESYVSSRSQANFSHSVCPACAQKLYPEYEDCFSSKK